MAPTVQFYCEYLVSYTGRPWVFENNFITFRLKTASTLGRQKAAIHKCGRRFLSVFKYGCFVFRTVLSQHGAAYLTCCCLQCQSGLHAGQSDQSPRLTLDTLSFMDSKQFLPRCPPKFRLGCQMFRVVSSFLQYVPKFWLSLEERMSTSVGKTSRAQ